MKTKILSLCILSILLGCNGRTGQSPERRDISKYNVVWESPSEDATGQMPLGNGNIAAGVYAIEDGDLYLLLAKNDVFTYSGDIFKTGRVGISLNPNPFNLFGLGYGTEDIVANTMEHRSHKNSFDYKCWTQDQIHWAYAGNAAEAKEGLVHRFRHASTQCRFPVYGSQGPDSCPDFDHFGAGSTALQRMLVQEAGDKILLLPAWPSDWDTDFKLHLSDNTIITGQVIDGNLVDWSIKPMSRKNDVIVYQPQPEEVL